MSDVKPPSAESLRWKRLSPSGRRVAMIALHPRIDPISNGWSPLLPLSVLHGSGVHHNADGAARGAVQLPLTAFSGTRQGATGA
mmetsp:Transcript_16977/g.51355  ORF Transcript_16977/g.51355 Transcript_16977/m.51355 type:complete len:84 (+) Transcript_16977:2000-2251(+)|eukprot:scaffold145213_cov31-Tisochrysis_lutea.AAC.4